MQNLLKETINNMNKSNKRRFKCADEALAVWNLFVLIHPYRTIKDFISGYPSVEYYLSKLANDLHKSYLIHGSIYDENGRIEDKDVAHKIAKEVCKFETLMTINKEDVCKMLADSAANKFLESGEIRGTIFY